MQRALALRMMALLLAVSIILSLFGCSANTPPAVQSEAVPSSNPGVTATPEPTGNSAIPSAPTATPEVTGAPATPSEPATTPAETIPPAAAPTETIQSPVSTPPEEVTDEYGLTEQQRNSFSMLYYLAITAEKIRIAKDNRLILDDIYTSLLNDINPGSIDETTQAHLRNLRDIIKSYISLSVKRERLQYIYNQNKAATIRSAVPNPLAVLSMTRSFDWKRLAANAVYTVVDSYNNYKSSNEAADQEFLLSGWELDDEETATIQQNRERVFDYMVDIVQEYDLDGQLTLNEEAIETFAEICAIESVQQKIRRLESEEETYTLLGNYWLELADCYFETSQYEKCLDCVEKYNELATGIYRRDYNYAQILPKAIVAAQETYSGNDYIRNIEVFADSIIKNTSRSKEDWSIRYFAAQTYLDLYSRTDDQKYLEAAYNIVYDNVTILLDEQRSLNATYLSDVKELEIEEPDYRFMTKEEKKAAEKNYKNEQKRLKDYNKSLKEIRKTELPSLYEPLILNCDLLFALAEKMQISSPDKAKIEAILQTDKNDVFLVNPVNNHYSFSKSTNDYSIDLSKDKIIIPVELLSADAKIVVTVTDNGKSETFDDCVVSKVERKASTIDSFFAHISSEQMKDYTWSANSKVTVKISNPVEDNSISLRFKVIEYKANWIFPDTMVFEQE